MACDRKDKINNRDMWSAFQEASKRFQEAAEDILEEPGILKYLSIWSEARDENGTLFYYKTEELKDQSKLSPPGSKAYPESVTYIKPTGIVLTNRRRLFETSNVTNDSL